LSNLTSTQPAAFDALLSLLTAAGATQSPVIPVFDTELVQYEPTAYVLLKGYDAHNFFRSAALGSFAFEETFSLQGCVTYFQGNIDPKTVRDKTWSIFQNVVMTTVVTNRGAPAGNPVLGVSAPTELEWVIPEYARYTSSPGSMNGVEEGFQGSIDFSFQVFARITTA
jgi:hypothetical protein